MARAAAFSGVLAAYAAAATGAVRARQAPAAAPPPIWQTGVFTADQAERGRKYFGSNCASCHGEKLEGGEGKALAGATFWADWSERSVGELVNYVRTNMPFSDDGSLKGTLPTGTYVDIIAHILNSNGLPAGPKELTVTSGDTVQILPKEGAGELAASTVVRVVGCLGPRSADGSWRLQKATAPKRAAAAAEPAASVALGTRDYQLRFVLQSLTRFAGHRMVVTGLLLGAGGADGINVSSIASVADTCN